jgi:hypothetical protein
MIRTLNFAFIAMTGLVCLGLYRIAEEARVAQAELRSTRAATARENEMLTVLGAEWARLTQPARIQALASRHLRMSDAPTLELSSLTALPSRAAPQTTPIREANIIVPSPAPARRVTLATYPGM